MSRTSTLLAWLCAAIVAVLVFRNWSSLMAPAPLDLIVAQVQAPLGVVILSLAAALVALFGIAYLHHRIGTLIETRKQLKEVQRLQDLADKAEASRIENLHRLISTEFRLLNERLGPRAAPATAEPTTVVDEPPARPNAPFRPLSLTEIVTGRGRDRDRESA